MSLNRNEKAAVIEGATIVRIGTAIFGNSSIALRVSWAASGSRAYQYISGKLWSSASSSWPSSGAMIGQRWSSGTR